MKKSKKVERVPFRAKEPKSKPKVYVPPGARINKTPLAADPPFTEYDDIALEWVEKLKKDWGKD
ncbi:MAG: hypothetical protein M0R32_09565 [Candidatus Cloacimonetes bacterium]|jgi:hypothetical protein|nr:hypothetical protein [Candidatus Cloacimonadota bacterium]